MIARMNDECFENGESVQREEEVFGEGRTAARETTAFALQPRTLGELSCLFAEDAAERFVFNAEEFDADTPLFYYDQRWHDPNTGQFMSSEPIEHDTENAYRYVDTNPTNCVDPTGL